MPPDEESRLGLRLKEARAVDQSARDAARQLLTLLQQGSNANLIRFGFDRLEKESLELDRKVLAVRDELGAGVEVSESREMEALSNQAKTWRQFAAENRSVSPRIAVGRLELLLGRSAVQ